MAEDQLEPLITECPNCSTRFRVTESQLEVASGRVRCGACLTVFQGTEHLLWEDASGFETARQAQEALDELLSELEADSAGEANEERPETEPAGLDELVDLGSLGSDPPGSDFPAADDALPKHWEADERQLYVGHEDADHANSGYDDTDTSDPLSAPEAEVDEVAELDHQVADAAAGDSDTGEQPRVQQDHQLDEDLHGAGEELPPQPAPQEESDADERIYFGVSAEAAMTPDTQAAAPPARESNSDTLAPALSEASASVAAPDVSFAPEPRRWWMGLIMLLAVLALAGQIFWYQFESWGRDPALRPVYGFICDTLGCELPVLRDLKALRTEKLLVRSHPTLANALIVDTVIVNEADFAQPFPDLELRFTTIDGNLVAGRRFQPDEYLAGDLEGATMMAPDTPVRLALEIEDPGGDAVSYFLSFR
jgi:predicted Zn finger-like uncharacterized protein